MTDLRPTRRLPLEGSKNTRDLGGYVCAGGFTRWRAFIRSDSPQNLTAADIELLRGGGFCTAVDLRMRDEAARAPSALRGAPGFKVSLIPLNDDLDRPDFEGDVPGSMAGLYMNILDAQGAAVAAIFRVMAAAPGGVFFHCAVGKDRTGVIAMLLLGLAGVSDEDIVADYAVSDIYLAEIIERQKTVFGDAIEDFVFRSRPASMCRALKHLHAKYGGARKYLEAQGLGEKELRAVLEKLVETAGA